MSPHVNIPTGVYRAALKSIGAASQFGIDILVKPVPILPLVMGHSRYQVDVREVGREDLPVVAQPIGPRAATVVPAKLSNAADTHQRLAKLISELEMAHRVIAIYMEHSTYITSRSRAWVERELERRGLKNHFETRTIVLEEEGVVITGAQDKLLAPQPKAQTDRPAEVMTS